MNEQKYSETIMKMENKEHKEVEEQAKETQTQNATETEKELTDAEKLEAANEEIAQLKDKYLRQVAEFDNYRKRTLKEKTELILNGGEKVLSALLPILDDFDRAIENIQKSDDVNALKEGVELIAGKLNKTLASQGLQKMDAIGKPFDTDYHEAIALVPAQDEDKKNLVMDCVQPGYMLNDKVLRHAKVVVGN